MIWLVAGILTLLLLLAILHSLANARPERLIGIALGTGILLAALFALFLLATGRIGMAIALAMPALLGLLRRRALLRLFGAQQSWQARQAAGATGRGSRIATDWLDLTLDHASGELSGQILKGRFAGRRLESLSRAEATALRDELRDDPDSLRLLDAAIERLFGEDGPARDGQKADRDQAPHGRSGMTSSEAAEILGVSADASPREIRAAHRRLMKLLHPDRGGTAYLAARINEARDCLLGKRPGA
ncbi:MAG: hypothetical protein Kow00104_15330 [Rhodothalassiaceae bacterium]